MKAKQPEITPLSVVNFLPFFSHTDLLAYTPEPLRLRLSLSILLNKITFFFAQYFFLTNAYYKAWFLLTGKGGHGWLRVLG